MFLEGGYDLTALRSSVLATLSAALGDAITLEEPSHGGPGIDHVARAHRDRLAALESMRSRDSEGTEV